MPTRVVIVSMPSIGAVVPASISPVVAAIGRVDVARVVPAAMCRAAGTGSPGTPIVDVAYVAAVARMAVCRSRATRAALSMGARIFLALTLGLGSLALDLMLPLTAFTRLAEYVEGSSLGLTRGQQDRGGGNGQREYSDSDLVS